MANKIIRLNGDLFEVDSDELAEIERNSYVVKDNGEVEKDWIKITEWIELHGIYVGEQKDAE